MRITPVIRLQLTMISSIRHLVCSYGSYITELAASTNLICNSAAFWSGTEDRDLNGRSYATSNISQAVRASTSAEKLPADGHESVDRITIIPSEPRASSTENVHRKQGDAAALLAGTPQSEETDVFKLGVEQPTLVEEPEPSKKTGSTPQPQARKKEKKKKRETSMDTIFENIDEKLSLEGSEKKPKKPLLLRLREMMKEDDGGGYENLVDGTKTKEEEEKKKADDKAKTKNKDSVEKDDDGAYENLPTPPKEQQTSASVSDTSTGLKTGAGPPHTTRGGLFSEIGPTDERESDSDYFGDESSEGGTQLGTLGTETDLAPGEEGGDDLLTGTSHGSDASVAARAQAVPGSVQKRERKVKRSRWSRTIMDILAIMCLLPLMNDYLILPVHALSHGGWAFIFAYLIILLFLVYPILCLVLFVSQCTQRGLVNVYKLYGRAYRGIGYGYMVLVFVSQTAIIHQGSILIKHLLLVYSDSLQIASCGEPYVEKWDECSSVLMDLQCLAANSSFEFYSEGFCWSYPIGTTPSGTSYMRFLLTPNYINGIDVEDFARRAVQLLAIGVLALAGPRILIALLATLMLVFIVIVAVDAVSEFGSNSFEIIQNATDFHKLKHFQASEMLYLIKVWISALQLAFSSSGLAQVTVFCMSSFRAIRANHFTTATSVIVGKIFISLLGLHSLLGHIAFLRDEISEHTLTFPTESKDITFYPAFMVEVYSAVRDYSLHLYSNAEVLFLYHITGSLAAMFMILALARCYGSKTFWDGANFVVAYSVFCLFYSLVVSFDVVQIFSVRYRHLVLFCSLYLYMAATIVITAFCSGINGYFNDIKELYSHQDNILRSLRNVFHALALHIAVVALLLICRSSIPTFFSVLQVNEWIQIFHEEKQRLAEINSRNRSTADAGIADWELTQESASIVAAFIPFIIPILVGVWSWMAVSKKQNKRLKMFTMCGDHPAYRRRLRRERAKKKKQEEEAYKEVTAKEHFDEHFPNEEKKSGEDVEKKSKEEVTGSKDKPRSAESAQPPTGKGLDKQKEGSTEKKPEGSAEKVPPGSKETMGEKAGSAERKPEGSAEKVRPGSKETADEKAGSAEKKRESPAAKKAQSSAEKLVGSAEKVSVGSKESAVQKTGSAEKKTDAKAEAVPRKTGSKDAAAPRKASSAEKKPGSSSEDSLEKKGSKEKEARRGFFTGTKKHTAPAPKIGSKEMKKGLSTEKEKPLQVKAVTSKQKPPQKISHDGKKKETAPRKTDSKDKKTGKPTETRTGPKSKSN
ncbi:hypothetical protein Q1695_011839 [Nippostrongylus brasiliensis]|nr:hypothetical protein Q1695_011839 [Nippostrongylus brasiliensis]